MSGRLSKAEAKALFNFVEERDRESIDTPVDIIVINALTGELQNIDINVGMTDLERIRNRIERLNKEYREFGDNYEAVAVKTGSVSWGSVYNIISLTDLIIKI